MESERRPVAALLDTNILLAYVNSDEPTPLLAEFDELLVSSLSWAELVRGLYSQGDLNTYKKRKRSLDLLLERFGEGLAFSDECLASFDLIMEHLAGQQRPVRPHAIDRMIAATAHAHGLAVVTRDQSGFAGLEDLVPILIK